MRETLAAVARALGYSWRQTDQTEDRWLTGVAVDSRAVAAGDLFVALRGEKTDGHRYLRQALEAGAAAVAVSDEAAALKAGAGNYLVVDDGLRFVQRLASWLRGKTAAPVVAVTGSTGKTSTKDFLTALLSALGPVVATEGNHNNELGLPLTLCRLEDTTRAVVLEMGMRGLGQIDFLCGLAAPEHGVITNIGMTHCALLGSQENIARAKCELLPYIGAHGFLALNKKDEPLLRPWLNTCRGRILWYDASDDSCDLWASEIREEAGGVCYQMHWRDGAAVRNQRVALPVAGAHNVSNSLAAAAVALSLGVAWEEIGPRLAGARLTGQRLAVGVSRAGVTVIDDAYNANPDSMRSALAVLAAREGGRRIAVLGDMYELGQYEAEGHRAVGRAAAGAGIDRLVAVGALGRLIGEAAADAGLAVVFADDNAAAIARLADLVRPGDVVLVKGSRGMHMEQIVENLMG